MEEIQCPKLREKIKSGEILLVDVREPFEFAAGNLGGVNIPSSSIAEDYVKIPKDKKVVIYCRSGGRSTMVIQFLQQNHGYTKLINLDGGILTCN